MEPDWLKAEDTDYWTAQLGSLSLTVHKTQFNNYSYAVSDPQRVRKAGNVSDAETAKAEAVRHAQQLS